MKPKGRFAENRPFFIENGVFVSLDWAKIVTFAIANTNTLVNISTS